METTKMLSASDLIKKSAMQIKYLRDHTVEKVVTPSQLEGEQFQNTQAIDLEAVQEMRGIYKKNDLMIFFVNDMILPNRIIECKSVDLSRETPDWYFESSVLQAAFYKSLLMNTNGILTTPTFKLNKGYKNTTIKVDPNIEYQLLFGSVYFSIQITKKQSLKIIQYFVDKAIATYDWNTAKEYDRVHKFKHYSDLKDQFKIEDVSVYGNLPC
jgi:hypothetical protein